MLSGEKLTDVDKDDVRELLNYKKAFELVASYLGEGSPITEGLIREIHKRLVTGVRGNSATPGEYRKIQNYVANSKTKEIIYTPPPAHDVPHLMQELVSWLGLESQINPLLVAGIAQFQLVHVHPFIDGNGRSARLLSTLCLYRSGYDFKKLFTISEYYDRNRSAYYKAIQSVRQNDLDMTVWLEYFVQGLATQMQEVREKGEEIIKLDIFAQIHELSKRQKEIVEFMAEKLEFKIQDYLLAHPKMNRRTLQRDLKILLDKNLISSEGATNKLVYRLTKKL